MPLQDPYLFDIVADIVCLLVSLCRNNTILKFVKARVIDNSHTDQFLSGP